MAANNQEALDSSTPPDMEPRPVYTVPELATMMGRTPKQMRTFLSHFKIQVHAMGWQRLVFAADIREGMPRLWDSIIDCVRERRRLAAEAEAWSMPGVRPGVPPKR